MSNDPPVHIPMLGDRVIIAAGEDAATGSNKLQQLLDRIASDDEEPRRLSAQEKTSLRAVRAGKFKRGRGQYKGDGRLEQGERAYELRQWLLPWLKSVRDDLKRNPAEKAYKRERREFHDYDLSKRAAKKARELLYWRRVKRRRRDPDFVIMRVPSIRSLRKMLHG